MNTGHRINAIALRQIPNVAVPDRLELILDLKPSNKPMIGRTSSPPNVNTLIMPSTNEAVDFLSVVSGNTIGSMDTLLWTQNASSLNSFPQCEQNIP
jgi:hypothetical protein